MIKKLLILFLFIYYGIFLYILGLNTIPYAFHGDEAETAIHALEIQKDYTNVIGVTWYDLPVLSFFPYALSMQIFGATIAGNRLGSALLGIATLPIFFLLVELLFNKRIAFIATLLLATSHVYIALSRIGAAYIQATFIVVCFFYCIQLAIRQNKKIYFALAGIFMALCFYTYYAARIAPLIILPFLLWHIFKTENRKRTCFNLLIFFLTFILVFLPQGIFYSVHPKTFSSRSEGVFIFSQENLPVLQQTYATTSKFNIFWEQTKSTFNIFQGDNSGQYGVQGQLFDYLTIAFFILGIAFVIRFFNTATLFTTIWFLLCLIVGQILTTGPHPPFLPRFSVGLPALFVICALGFELLFKLLHRWKYIYLGITIFALAVICSVNLYTYFFSYLQSQKEDARGASSPMQIAYYINTLAPTYKVFFITAPYLHSEHPTIHFLSKGIERINIIDQENNPTGFEVLQRRLTHARNSVFIVHAQYESILSELKNLYPDGSYDTIITADKKPEFYVFKTN